MAGLFTLYTSHFANVLVRHPASPPTLLFIYLAASSFEAQSLTISLFRIIIVIIIIVLV
jgi:hypothetical protein